MADSGNDFLDVLGNVADGIGAAGAPLKGAQAWWRRDEAKNILRDVKRELDRRWGKDPLLNDAYEQVARLLTRVEVAEAFEAAVEGDPVALERVRDYLSDHLGASSRARSKTVAEVVADVVGLRLGRAQRSPEAAIDVVGRRLDENSRRRIERLHNDLRSLRSEIAAGFASTEARQALANEQVRLEADRVIDVVREGQRGISDEDVTWAPLRAQYVLERLRTKDAVGAGQLRLALKDRELRDELPGLVDHPPEWLRDGTAELWLSIGRLCEVTGDWEQATKAFVTASDRPGSDRARVLMAAAGAAGFAGDATKAKALRERAAAINHRHPVVRIVAMRDEADARKRLAELDKLAPTGDAEIDALVDAVRTIALLDAGEFEAATVPASRASQLAPWLPTVREAGPAVVVARNRSRRRAGAATERRELLEAAEEYRRLCDDLRESRRFEESGGMLQRVAECQSLADRPDLARVSLSEALPDELSSGDVALMLAETAINAGAPELAERLVASYAGKHEAAELLRAHLGLRDSQRRRAAVETLDRLVKAGNYEAAVARMVAGVPRTEDVPWSDDAEAIVRRTEPVLAAFAKAEWHDRRDRPTEARRELARYADDPRALKELMVQFGQRGEWKKAASAARSLLQKGPDVAARVMVAQVLRRAGEGAEAEAILRQVLEAQDVHAAELADAFDELATELLQQGRLREAFEIAESTAEKGYPEAAWVSAYVLAREGNIAVARERIDGLTPRALKDTTLAVDLHFKVDRPDVALMHMIDLADALPEPDEQVELKLTLALLRIPEEAVSPELVARAGPEQFVARFPQSKVLWRQQIDDDKDAIDVLRQHARARAQVANAAEAHVLDAGDRPVGTLAFAVGLSLAEVWAQLPKLPLAYDGQPIDDEVDAVRAAAASPAIFETSALHSLHVLGAGFTDAVLAEFPLSIVAQATTEDLIRASTPALTDGQEVVRQVRWSSELNEIVLSEMSPEEASRPREIAEAMQRLAGRLHPGPAIRVDWDKPPNAVAMTYAEVLELAKRTGYPVFSDDRFFRAMLKGAGIPTFGSIALIAGLTRTGAVEDETVPDLFDRLRNRAALGMPAARTES